MRLLSICVLLPAVIVAAPLKRNNWLQNCGGNAEAAYFLDNNPAGSSIVSLYINNDGTLSDPVRTSTDGYGVIGVNGTGFPNAADPLFSQSTVTVRDNLLFTVNSGSNTLAMFHIDPQDPWNPQLVGSPADTLGEVPMSVTYSAKLRTACVLNGGAKAGVSCFSVDPFQGLHAAGPLRSLGKSINYTTTPPTGPPETTSQVIFAPDSSAVFAIVKGNPGLLPGTIIGWAVEGGHVSEQSVVNQFADIPLAFGATFLDQSRLFISDPSYGASILNISNDLKITEEVHTVIPTQSAICWTAYDRSLGTAYALDAGAPLEYAISAGSGALEGSFDLPTQTGGIFDSAIAKNLMYSLTGGNGVAVIDLVERTQVQYLDLSSFGSRPCYTGMALWP